MGLAAQARPADQVVAVAREDDASTSEVLQAWQSRIPLRTVSVTSPGVVQALNAGVEAVTGDLVAITDDDAVPRTDWLARIERHFAANPGVAGVGGRDWVHHATRLDVGERPLVGRVLWFGRVVGNHHLGVGPPRQVDILKGVNCAYRTALLRDIQFDTTLRGSGAQAHWEIALGLELRRRGWHLLYDPDVAVDHYLASRFDMDQRDQFHPQATSDTAYNLYWAIAAHMQAGERRRLALIWQRSIGTPGEPGAMRDWAGRVLRDGSVRAKAAAARDGRKQARIDFDRWAGHLGTGRRQP